MSSRWICRIATTLLLTLGSGVAAQAQPLAAGAASLHLGSFLDELKAYGLSLLLPSEEVPLCGHGHALCPTPPGPPPPVHTVSVVASRPRPSGRGTRQ
jgi:hypothetical protein